MHSVHSQSFPLSSLLSIPVPCFSHNHAIIHHEMGNQYQSEMSNQYQNELRPRAHCDLKPLISIDQQETPLSSREHTNPQSNRHKSTKLTNPRSLHKPLSSLVTAMNPTYRVGTAARLRTKRRPSPTMRTSLGGASNYMTCTLPSAPFCRP